MHVHVAAVAVAAAQTAAADAPEGSTQPIHLLHVQCVALVFHVVCTHLHEVAECCSSCMCDVGPACDVGSIWSLDDSLFTCCSTLTGQVIACWCLLRLLAEVLQLQVGKGVALVDIIRELHPLVFQIPNLPPKVGCVCAPSPAPALHSMHACMLQCMNSGNRNHK